MTWYQGVSDVKGTLHKYQKVKMGEIFQNLVKTKIYYVESQASLQEQVGRLKNEICVNFALYKNFLDRKEQKI